MKNMKDGINVKDLSWEHSMHGTYEKNCSTCYSESRLIQAKKTVMGRPLGDNYSLGVNPNDF